jgi:hypothetical protein
LRERAQEEAILLALKALDTAAEADTAQAVESIVTAKFCQS